jgi:hypothetical protein
VVPLACYVALLLPLESNYLMDTRGGRLAVELLPWHVRFGGDGPNTRLLASYLGPTPPQWRHADVRSMLLRKWRDGNERVHRRSIIFRSDLSAILSRLPPDEARAQVLRCATDPDNLLRVHQGLLLVCLNEWGYPPGHDAKSWWARHGPLFRQEYDAGAAVRTVAGWTDALEKRSDQTEAVRSQLRAARYQEHGNWGGDAAFGEAFCELSDRADGRPIPELVGGLAAVDWWP